MIRAIAVYSLLEAWRSRLPGLGAALIGAAFVAAELVEAVAITEAAETRSVLFAAMLRGCAVLVLGLFAVTSGVREEDDRVLELLLSQPRPRADYYFGKLAAFCVLSAAGAALGGLCLLLYAPLLPVLLWTASLAMELVIVVAFSLLSLLTFRRVTLAFCAVLAFYVLARTIGVLRLMSESPLSSAPGWSEGVVDLVVLALYHLLPDLGRFASSAWFVHPPAGGADLLPLALQTLACLALLAGAALFDLYRRNL